MRLPTALRLLVAVCAGVCLWVAPAHAIDAFSTDGDRTTLPSRLDPVHAPWKGEGFIGAAGAGRWVPQDDFVAAMLRNSDFKFKARPFATAGVQAPFGYVFERDWAAVIDFSFAYDTFEGTSASGSDKRQVDLTTLGIARVAEKLLDVGIPWWQPYAAGGLGIYLSTARGLDPAKPTNSTETNVSGGFLALGSRFALSGGLGLMVEVRASIAEATLIGTGIAQVGGVTGAAGVYYAWRQ